MPFPIRLIHPRHGATHVYTETELTFHKAQGWEDEATVKAPEPEPVEADEPEDPPRRGPGRPRTVR